MPEMPRSQRLAFVAGLIASPLLHGLFAAVPRPQIDASYGALVTSGLLVGLGTRLVVTGDGS